jgi:hypothetical protein
MVEPMGAYDLSALTEARWLDRNRVNGYAKILALAALALVAAAHVMFWRDGSDFLAFWSAARLALDGAASGAYDTASLLAYQARLGFPEGSPFLNPPPYLLAVLPFGLLAYPVALAVWLGVTFGLYAASLRWLPRDLYWPALAFPTGAVCALAGQNGFLTSALIIAALGFQRDRKVLAGVLIGCLVIKPHLALLFPVALIAARDGRTFAAAAATAVGLLILSVAAFGTDTLTAFLSASAYAGSLVSDASPVALKNQSVMALAASAGFPGWLLQALAALVACAAVYGVWRRSDDPLERAAVLAAATPLAVPYLFAYDLPFLILPLAYLAREGVRLGFARGGRLALVGLYLSPLAILYFAGAFALTPFMATVLLAAVCWSPVAVSSASPGPTPPLLPG